MSVPMNTSSFTKALWPGVNAWYGKAYNEFAVEYTDLFDTNKSRKHFEEDVGISGFGLAQIKPEGGNISYDDQRQGFISRYTHVVYALGFAITREAYEDDLYDVVGQKRAQGLAFSMRQTKELVAANVWNRAFNSSFSGGDGVSLINQAHPTSYGATYSNQIGVASDLSEASLEQATIDIMKMVNDRGLRIAVMPQSLHIAPENMYEAERILKSPFQYNTANNAVNALKSMGKFPKGAIVNHYFSDPDAWFIRTNVPDGLKHFERRADEFDTHNDFDTQNAKYMATARYSFGWTDPRAIYGSPGA